MFTFSITQQNALSAPLSSNKCAECIFFLIKHFFLKSVLYPELLTLWLLACSALCLLWHFAALRGVLSQAQISLAKQQLTSEPVRLTSASILLLTEIRD